jgi:hypothetical protein
MKCIKCIKVAKGYELDEIRRVKDDEAEERVKGGYWKYIPKSEWKAVSGKVKSEVSEEVVTEKVKSKKQLRKEKVEA